MEQYEQLLKDSKKELLLFKNDNNYSGTTGIDDSLVQPYLNQIIELNNIMYTIGSTNEPSILFQPMFLIGFIHKKYITDEFIDKLKKLNLSFIISKDTSCCKNKIMKPIHYNIYTKHVENQILNDMLCKWWFNKSIDIPEDSFDDFIIFRNSYNDELPIRFNELYNKIWVLKSGHFFN